MSELFEDADEDEDEDENQLAEVDEVVIDTYQPSPSDARRRLEALLADKKLKDDLEDFFDEE